MNRIWQDLRVCLFIFRWFVFLAAFLFYVEETVGQFTLLYFLVALNLLYTILLFRQASRFVMVSLTLFDLLINIRLIADTGGWNSSFTIYAYTTLFWLGTYVNRWKLVLAAFLFFIGSLFYTKQSTKTYILSDTSTELITFFLQVITMCSIYFAFVFIISLLLKLYRASGCLLRFKPQLQFGCQGLIRSVDPFSRQVNRDQKHLAWFILAMQQFQFRFLRCRFFLFAALFPLN